MPDPTDGREGAMGKLACVQSDPFADGYGVVKNVHKTESLSDQSYSIVPVTAGRTGGDMSLILAFSGGRTRAAALAYGVLQELRDTPVVANGRETSMLDEIDVISSVSGGRTP